MAQPTSKIVATLEAIVDRQIPTPNRTRNASALTRLMTKFGRWWTGTSSTMLRPCCSAPTAASPAQMAVAKPMTSTQPLPGTVSSPSCEPINGIRPTRRR